MIAAVTLWLSTIGGRVIVAGVLVLALVSIRAADVAHQRKVGAKRAVEKIEKSNATAVKTTTAVRAKSRSVGVRGKLDPYTID